MLADPRLAETVRRVGPALVKQQVRAAQDACRRRNLAAQGVADAAVAAVPLAAATLRRSTRPAWRCTPAGAGVPLLAALDRRAG